MTQNHKMSNAVLHFIQSGHNAQTQIIIYKLVKLKESMGFYEYDIDIDYEKYHIKNGQIVEHTKLILR